MRLTTSKKLWLGFSAVLVLLMVVNTFSIRILSTLSENYQEIIDIDMKKVDLAENIQVVEKDKAYAVLEFAMFGKEEAINKINAGIEQGTGYAKMLIEMTSDEESLKLLEDLQVDTQSLFKTNDTIISLKRNGQDVTSHLEQSSALNAKVLNILDQLIAIQGKSSEQTRQELDNLSRNMMTFVITICSISLAVGIAVAFFISRGIANPVKKITAGLEQIAEGNLQIEPIYIKNKDEIGVMAATYNRMLTDLKGIVSSVRDSSLELAANAEQLSASAEQSLASSQMVSVATEQQLELGIEQTKEIELSANSMNQLNQSVLNISSDNDEMRNATSGVQALVTKGSTVVTDVANNMNIIHTTFNDTTDIMMNMAQHSSEIQQVTLLIKDISEQTNLLALNAAIEAARAGEYGKGFAVVAEQVRKLAEQSKHSAAEIEHMVGLIQAASDQAVKAITSGGAKMEEGLFRTNESLHVFQEIESSVFDVVDKVESVSHAIEEIQVLARRVTVNSTRVQELTAKTTDSANETSAATQEQLATTEEISSNAQSLAELAEQLQSKVNHFNI